MAASRASRIRRSRSPSVPSRRRASVTIVLTGILQMLFAWFRLGKLIRMVPHPVMMGFVNGFAFAGMEQTFSLLIKLRIFTSPTEGVDAAVKDADARNASFYSGFLFFFIEQAPSSKRWDQREKQQELNKLVKSFISKGKNMVFIPMWQVFIGSDGKPNDSLYVEDKLHNNAD